MVLWYKYAKNLFCIFISKTKFSYLHILGTLDAGTNISVMDQYWLIILVWQYINQALLSSAGGDLFKIEPVTLSNVIEQQF